MFCNSICIIFIYDLIVVRGRLDERKPNGKRLKEVNFLPKLRVPFVSKKGIERKIVLN